MDSIPPPRPVALLHAAGEIDSSRPLFTDCRAPWLTISKIGAKRGEMPPLCNLLIKFSEFSQGPDLPNHPLNGP
jgi:hypothetical protein